MNTLNRKSKNSKNNDRKLSFGVKSLVTGVAITAMCMSGFATGNVPGFTILEVEAKELHNTVRTEALAINTVNLHIESEEEVIVPPFSEENLAMVQGEIHQSLVPLVERHPESDGSPEVVFSTPDDLKASTQNVDDSENPEIKEQRDLERKLKEDEELLEKYSFALYTSSGQRNDITPDILRLAEATCAEQGIDCNLWLSLVMTESEGKANAKNRSSTATGLGQLLKGTGEYVYEDIMGNPKGSYNHNMAYDPALNTRMSITLLGYLKRTEGSMYAAIQSYRGKKDISGYTGRMNRWLALQGMNVDSFL